MSALLNYWHKGYVRATIYQWGLLAALIFIGVWLVDTASTNLTKLGIRTGFEFLSDEAGFAISPALFSYEATSSYGEAILVTLLNTIVLSVIAIFFATFVGFFVAVSRLSKNWILRNVATAYVEVFRNIPLLLQLFFWYFAALKLLPGKRQSVNILDVAFLNVEGFVMPAPIFEPGAGTVGVVLILALMAAFALHRWAKNRQMRTGVPFPSLTVGLAIIIFAPLLAAWAQGFPLGWEIPKFGRFNFEGGIALQPEFTAMLFGLTLYNGAFIGEIIRAGIMSVHKGQREAAHSIGFTSRQIYLEILIPQAMRLIIPPLTNQYLNLTKSTALAAAIGYPDFFWAVSGAIVVQTGQVLELQAITLGSYLGISLVIAMTMNWYNRVSRIRER